MKIKPKIFDKKRNYYGCKSLGREHEMYVDGDKTMLRQEQVLAYHYARGASFPKLDILTMPLKPEVKDLWYNIGIYGQSHKEVSI